MQAWINNIQRFSIHDGPGIRTTVFFQGCNLRCRWCHNPDTIPMHPVFTYVKGRCLHCGGCVSACSAGALRWEEGRPVWREDFCTDCGACGNACPTGACALSAVPMSVKEILAVVERDKPFYAASGGGMTCSGGEAMLRGQFLRELLSGAKALDISTGVDTAASVPWEWIESLFDVADLFLVDFKLYDEAGHKAATGTSNRLIQENLRRFAGCPVAVTIRIPVIPTVNADAATMEQMAAFLAEINFRGPVELLKFHRLGDAKYEALGIHNPFAQIEPPEDTQMALYRRIMAEHGLAVVTED